MVPRDPFVVYMSDTTELITAEELSEHLRVRPATIRLWAREGRIPRVKISGKVIRYNISDVLNELQGKCEDIQEIVE